MNDPFIIANYNVISSGLFPPGITISDTTVYFKMENIIIYSNNPNNAGLTFSNVANAVLKNVTASLGIPSVDGFDLSNSYNNTIVNCKANNNYDGFLLSGSWNNTLVNNTAEGNQYMTIALLSGSYNNTLTNNIMKNNPFLGFGIINSYNNYVINNSIINNGFKSTMATNLSVILVSAPNNTLQGNIIPIDFILLSGSPNSTLSNNTFGGGLFFQTSSLNNDIQGPVTNNYVSNNKPLIYWQNTKGGTVPIGAGQIILMNTTNALITGQTLSNEMIEASNLYSNKTMVTNCQFLGIYFSIYSYKSNNFTVTNNNFFNSPVNIILGTNATITNNHSNNATLAFIDFSNVTMKGNSVKYSKYGYYFESSKNITVSKNVYKHI